MNALVFLPSENEWYKAAYHKNDGVTGNYFDYSTSSDSVPSNDLINPDPGNNATFFDYGYTIGSPYHKTEVGAHENSDSPYGTFDQSGNVWEWTETLVYSTNRVMRGGAFNNSSSSIRSSYRYNYNPSNESDHPIGFRVASVYCDYIIAGDINGDCKVNFSDFAVIAMNWLLNCNQTPGDPACVPK